MLIIVRMKCPHISQVPEIPGKVILGSDKHAVGWWEMELQRYGLVFVGLLVIAVTLLTPVSAAVITIDTTYAGGISQAIIDAGSGGTVILQPGTYNQDSITIPHDITVMANSSFGGSAADTIIDAQTLGRIFDNSGGHALAIDNLTLQDGHPGGAGAEYGGAIYAGTGSAVTITSSTIADCEAEGAGAIWSFEGTLTITSTTITGCSATNGPGGAVLIQHGSASITSTAITGCTAENGGAIYTLDSTMSITTSTFTGCTAPDYNGGAIYTDGETASITSTTFTDCRATSGGSVNNHGGSVTITSSTFTGTLTEHGGAVYTTGGTVSIISSTFSGFFPTQAGGAIFIDTGTVTITSSSFTSCSSEQGGAVYTTGGTVTITSSTFTGCTTTGDGGAIASYGSSSVTIYGSNITDCQATGNGGAIWSDGGDVAVGMTTISGCTASSGGAISTNGGTLGVGNVDIINCTAADNGGAIHAVLSPVTIFHSDFTNCSSVAGNGGAVWTSGDPLTVYNTNWFLNCTAGDSGGAIYYDNVAVSIHSTMIWLCSAANNGGGIAGTGPVTVIGSSFGECSSGGDGGMISGTGDLEIVNTLFFHNSASGDGGAISTGGGTLNVTTSVFERCQAGRGGAVRSTGTGDIHYTRFYPVTATGDGPAVYASAAVDATNNWWGSNSDPSAQVFGPVTTDPWLELGITADPAAIMSTETSTISTNLTYNSAGADTSGGGSLMEYNILNWYAVTAGSGSVSPAMDVTYQRVAQTTFTPLYGETVTISGRVDDQTVYITLPVAQAAPVPTGITPDTGINSRSAAITDLAGSSFTIIGTTTVTLVRAGQANITATGVTVVDNTQITCTLPITGAEAGAWDVVVTNPDGREGVLPGGFTVTAPVPTAVPTWSPEDTSGTLSDFPPSALPLMTVTVNIGGDSKAWQAIVTGTKLSGLIVTGTVQSGPGSNLTAPPGTVFQYINLIPARYTSITNAVVNFTVPQSWLDENHIDPESIVLYHWTANSWEALPTRMLYTKDGTVYFSARSDAFSLFAIAGTPMAATPLPTMPTPVVISSPVPEQAPVPAAVAKAPVTTQTTAQPREAPETPAGSPPFPVLPALIGTGCVALVAGGWYVRRWWIRRQNPALFREYD